MIRNINFTVKAAHYYGAGHNIKTQIKMCATDHNLLLLKLIFLIYIVYKTCLFSFIAANTRCFDISAQISLYFSK